MNKKTVVSDTGPLLHLAEINQQSQLSIFLGVHIPKQIMGELERFGFFEKIALTLKTTLTVDEVSHDEIAIQAKSFSRFKVHTNDLCVAALAAKLSPDLILTDDLELRKGLESKGYMVVGSIGILVSAYKTGILQKVELQEIFTKLFDGSTLYLSKGFKIYVLKLLDNMN